MVPAGWGERANRAIKTVFEDVEAKMSEWRASSPLSAVNRAAGQRAVTVPPSLLEVVKRGIARDPKTLPRIERARSQPNGSAIVELLKVLLRMTAERHGVAAKVIATVDDLEQIAANDDADVRALKGWRRELFGERALALKHGELALAIERHRVVAVERKPHSLQDND